MDKAFADKCAKGAKGVREALETALGELDNVKVELQATNVTANTCVLDAEAAEQAANTLLNDAQAVCPEVQVDGAGIWTVGDKDCGRLRTVYHNEPPCCS